MTTSNFQNQQGQPNHTVIVQQVGGKSNGVGTAGFVLSLVALFLGSVPFIGWILWLLGIIFSFAGIFKQPRGLAIAGLVISLIGIIVILFISGTVLALLGAAFY